MPESRENTLSLCPCGCNRMLSRSSIWRHLKAKAEAQARANAQAKVPMVHESFPPPKRRRIAHFQADGGGSSSSGHPELHAPSSEFNPSLPSLDPPAPSGLLQSPGDARSVPSHRFVDGVLLSLHARTHRTDESDSEDSKDTVGGNAGEATNTIDPGPDDFWDGEDVDVEGEVDPRRGIVSDWDLLTEGFIVKAKELRKFCEFFLHTQ